ncbi:diguanylate cyclase [Oscillospiraceae bacterium MB08-C2-2]|nr:diguanylate cyclase [Oscillospiraceae bacterium MB08-C2-2]
MAKNSMDEHFKQLEGEYRLLAESALESIWHFDIATLKFTYVSPSVLKLRGFTAQETLQQTLEELLPPDSLAKAQNVSRLLLERYMKGERRESMLTKTGDYELYCRHAVIKQVEISVKLLENAETGAMEIIGVTRDITERKRFEEQLNQAIKTKNDMINRLRKSEKALKLLTDKLNQQNAILSNLAIKDNLTGIFNRYSFNQKILEEADRSRLYNQPLSIVLFDIDDFKKVNDTFGHQIGDEILIRISEAVSQLVRKQDVLARWGGEEFVILLPQTRLSDAARVAEKLRIAIENIDHPEVDHPVTVSFGVTEFMRGETTESWFRRVDYALFNSKNKGKNCVTSISWEEAVPLVQARLEWKAQWECGNAVIDDQHKMLVYWGNRLLDAVLASNEGPETAKALEELMEHIRLHFEAEERILAELGYPETQEHAEIHRGLWQFIQSLQEQYQAKSLYFGAVFSFLLDEVIVGHLLKEDVRFFPFLKEAPETV